MNFRYRRIIATLIRGEEEEEEEEEEEDGKAKIENFSRLIDRIDRRKS
jgi:hypothetical protein